MPVKVVSGLKPINSAFNRTSLIAHLAQTAAVEPKAVKAVVAALEATMLAPVHKKGLGTFTLPGLLKVNVINVPARRSTPASTRSRRSSVSSRPNLRP